MCRFLEQVWFFVITPFSLALLYCNFQLTITSKAREYKNQDKDKVHGIFKEKTSYKLACTLRINIYSQENALNTHISYVVLLGGSSDTKTTSS
jgi:hypothetical protein